MRVGIFTRGKYTHSYKWEDAFKRGLEKHGVETRWQTWGDKPRDIDLGVMWSHHNINLTSHFRNFGINYIVLERGYVGNREDWTSCGYNGLNGNADFVNEHIDGTRLPLVGDYLQPVRKTKGTYIVIMGQCQNDASVKWIGWNKWLQETYNKLKEITDKKIYYRPHPLQAEPFVPEGLEVIGGDLCDVLKKARCVITLNSNSGVDSILAGVPTLAMDRGSMVYDICSHDLEDVDNCVVPERDEWLQKMSFAQWNFEEIEQGHAWQHLKKRFKNA